MEKESKPLPPWVKPHLRRRLGEEARREPKEMEKAVVKPKVPLANEQDYEMAKRDLGVKCLH